MSEADRALEFATALGKVETTMGHLGVSLDEAKVLIRDSAEATGDLRVEVARGLAMVQERQAAQETETDRRFEVSDNRFDATNRKIDGIRVDFADHEKLEAAGEAHGLVNRPGRWALLGGGSAAGGVGIWVLIQRIWDVVVGSGTPPGGH